jgi:hypothetical protein
MTSTSIEEELEKVIHRALADSRNAGGAPLGLMDGLEAFLAAINWTEPFIIGVLACHVIFLLVAIFGRKQTGIQIGLLVLARQ